MGRTQQQRGGRGGRDTGQRLKVPCDVGSEGYVPYQSLQRKAWACASARAKEIAGRPAGDST